LVVKINHGENKMKTIEKNVEISQDSLKGSDFIPIIGLHKYGQRIDFAVDDATPKQEFNSKLLGSYNASIILSTAGVLAYYLFFN